MSRFLADDARADVKAAYLRFPYHESIHAHYFRGLRDNHIDVRPQLRGNLAEDWSFEPARNILLRYADDPRRADPSGPARPVSETVALLRAKHFAARPAATPPTGARGVGR